MCDSRKLSVFSDAVFTPFLDTVCFAVSGKKIRL